jgi:hypothetical protein
MVYRVRSFFVYVCWRETWRAALMLLTAGIESFSIAYCVRGHRKMRMACVEGALQHGHRAARLRSSTPAHAMQATRWPHGTNAASRGASMHTVHSAAVSSASAA